MVAGVLWWISLSRSVLRFEIFLRDSNFGLTDIYSGTTPGWTMLRRSAGFAPEGTFDEPGLSAAMSRMLHIDDPLRVSTYVDWLSGMIPPASETMSALETRLAMMLHFDLQLRDKPLNNVDATLERLWRPAARVSSEV